MGKEQAELLISMGADPEKIVIGHMCGAQSIDDIVKVLNTGVYISFDRFGIVNYFGAPTDEARIKNLLYLLEKGYEDKIVLSHDETPILSGKIIHWPLEFR